MRPFTDPDIDNLADTVNRAASAHGDTVALIDGERVLTWAELDAGVDAAAHALQARDLPASQGHPARVAIALPNGIEFALAYFGALRAGLVALPVNPGYTPRELRHILTDSAAALLVTAEPSEADLPRVGPDALRAPGVPAKTATGGEGLAVLLYTSGTSGAPKGAMLSHRALLANHAQVARIDPPIVGPGDVVLLALPLFHVFGLNSGLGAVAYHGATGVLVDRFEPAATLAAIARHRVSVVIAVPQMYAAWNTRPDLAERLTSARILVSGAAPLETEVGRGFQAATGRPVVEGYGLTETAPVVATGLGRPVAKPRSIGRPIPGVQVRLVAGDGAEIALVDATGLVSEDEYDDDFDDDAGGVPGTDPGEIVVRGANLFGGYWPDGQGGPDADGWWPTGDVAYADADGDLFLVDRLGELILVSGFNVYPHEVELVLTGHPAVAEAAAVGVPDPSTGQTVRAYVVVAEGGSVTVEELRAHCERNLARFKCPTGYEFVSDLPHSVIGKVRKGSLAR